MVNIFRLVFYIFIFLFIVQGVLSMNITPLDFNISVIENEDYNYSMMVYYDNATPHNFTIYNVSLRAPYVISEYINMSYNETKNLSFTVRTNTTLDNVVYIGYLNYYYLTLTTRVPESHLVYVSASGFSNYNLTAYLNDSIVFINNDTIDHSITDLDSHSTILLPINTTYNFTVEYRDYSFVDDNSLTGQFVYVFNNSYDAPTINPNYAIPISLKIRSVHKPSTLQATLTSPASPIDYDDKSLGVLVLRTNMTIFGLHMNSMDNWTTFSENDFDLLKEKIITFTVEPNNITESNQTGIVYEKFISISGINIETQAINYSISINFANISSGLENQTKLVYKPLTPQETERYCNDTGWDTPLCQRYLQNVTVIQYINRTIHPELTEETVLENQQGTRRIETDIGTLKSKVESSTNELTTLKEDIKMELNSTKEELASVKEDVAFVSDYIKGIRHDTNTRGIVFWTAFILVFIVIVTIIVSRARKNAKRLSTSI